MANDMDDLRSELGVSLAQALARSVGPDQAGAILRLAHWLFNGEFRLIREALRNECKALDGVLPDGWLTQAEQLLAADDATATDGKGTIGCIKSCSGSKAITASLLVAGESDWFRGEDGTGLYQHWMDGIAAEDAILLSVEHMGMVQPLLVPNPSEESSSSARVTALGAEPALKVLQSRFGSQTACDAAIGELVSGLSIGQSQINKEELSRLSRIAGALAGVPELVESWQQVRCAEGAGGTSEDGEGALAPGLFVRRVMQSFLHLGKDDDSGDDDDVQRRDGVLPLAGQFIERLAMRGGVQLAGQALARIAAHTWKEGIHKPLPALRLLTSIGDTRTGHRVLAAALSFEVGSCATALLDGTPDGKRFAWVDWNRLLLDGTMLIPPAALDAVFNHLGHASIVLPETVLRLTQAWSASCTEPAPRQAYLTLAVIKGVRRMDAADVEAGELLSALLKGVSRHLESPLREVRLRGMRVGRAFSELLALPKQQEATSSENRMEDQDVLFAQDLADLGWEEADVAYWEMKRGKHDIRNGSFRVVASSTASVPDPKGDNESDLGSVIETDSEDEAERLRPYNLTESDDEDAEIRRLSLREIIAGLSKGESEWKLAARALQAAELAVKAHPDELEFQADKLGRALLHAKLPAWIGEEIGQPVNVKRFRSLVATVAEVPEAAGGAIAEELYSPSLDVHQRALILGTLSSAALRLSGLGSEDDPAPLMHHQGTSRSSLSGPRTPSTVTQRNVSRGQSLGKTVWRADRRLQAMAEEVHGNPPGQVNRFLPVALGWTATLLSGVDKQHHGIDLFGRDAFLLGRLLVTLGTFLEASAGSNEAVSLSAATLEVVKASPVNKHAEPFVRRGAVLAVAQAATALPPVAAASALLAQANPEQGNPKLLELLEWACTWLEEVQQNDSDNACRQMAEAALKLHRHLQSLAALEMRNEARRHTLLEQGVLRVPEKSTTSLGINVQQAEKNNALDTIIIPKPAGGDFLLREVLPGKR